jgi:hypothetical protein
MIVNEFFYKKLKLKRNQEADPIGISGDFVILQTGWLDKEESIRIRECLKGIYEEGDTSHWMTDYIVLKLSIIEACLCVCE